MDKLEEYQNKLNKLNMEMIQKKPSKGSLVYQQLLIRQSMLLGFICCLKGEEI